VLVSFGGVSYADGAAILACDPYRITTGGAGGILGKFVAPSGAYGFGMKRATDSGGTPEFDIIDVEHYAYLIGFSITNSTGGLMKAANDQMLATIDYISDGITPPTNGDSEILVHDDMEVAPNAIAGATGIAFRNDRLGSAASPYYQIITCNQMCRQARATLAQTMAGPDNFQVDIANFFPDDESPEGLDAIAPFKTRAFNPHRHRGTNGDKIRLRWGNCTDPTTGAPRQGYIIEQVDLKTVRVPLAFRVNSSTKAIEYQRVKHAIESEENDPNNAPWEQMFPQKNCT
jgi:hypothetical protein